jgi:hypothetical protein
MVDSIEAPGSFYYGKGFSQLGRKNEPLNLIHKTFLLRCAVFLVGKKISTHRITSQSGGYKVYL